MPYCFFNNGLSFRGVPPDYQPQTGEVVLPTNNPSDAALEAAFPGYLAAKAERIIEERLATLETAMNDYIYSRYDQGTQSSFNALYLMPMSTPEIMAAIESIWTWVQTVIVQYYAWRAEIQAGGNPAINFLPFDSSDPKVKLETLMGLS